MQQRRTHLLLQHHGVGLQRISSQSFVKDNAGFLRIERELARKRQIGQALFSVISANLGELLLVSSCGTYRSIEGSLGLLQSEF